MLLPAILQFCNPAILEGNDVSAALRRQASDSLYNLDREQALELFRKAAAADPTDAAAYRGMATALWLSITFRRGNMTVDDYLGRVQKPAGAGAPAPAELVAGFREALDHALALSRERLARNGRDVDAHYQLGAAVGLQASFTATVDASSLGAFRAARDAYNEHETVLSLDAARKDAGLIVGTYRYIVAALALPLRWMAYVAGFGGGKETGIQMVEEAAAYAGDNQTDARLALVLMYNREKRYDDALKQLATLRERYPRDRLLWLEAGSTSLRAGRPAEAEKFLDDGIQRFASDSRPRMFGEDALWRYKRGAARAALGRSADARQDLETALALDGRHWVHGRAQLELARIALKEGRRAEARERLQRAASLCDSDNDSEHADEARQMLRAAP